MTTSFQLGLVLIGIGLLPGCLGGLLCLSRLSFLRRTVRVIGLVEEMTLMHRLNRHVYQPKITFTAQNGKKVRLVSLGQSNPPRFRVGQEVPLIYEPQQPHGARIRSFGSLWFAPLLFVSFGMLFFFIGLILLILNKN